MGAQIVSVGLEDLHPPVKVAPEYEKVIAATQTKQAKILAARADDIRTNALAGAQAVTTLNKANAERMAREVGALAQAALFTNQIPAFEAAPSVYAERAYLQTLRPGHRQRAQIRSAHHQYARRAHVRPAGIRRAEPAQPERAGAQTQIVVMKRNPLTLVIGLLLILIFGFLLFSFQVRTTEVAVVTTFGKPTRPITEPNLYFKWPWPIQKVWTFDQRVQNFEDRLTEGLTPRQLQPADLGLCWLEGLRPDGLLPPLRRQRRSDRGGGSAAGPDGWATPRRRSSASIRCPTSSPPATTGPASWPSRRKSWRPSSPRSTTNNLGLEIEFLGLKTLAAPGKRQPVGVRPHDLRAEGAGRPIPVRRRSRSPADPVGCRTQGGGTAGRTPKRKATQIKGAGEAEAAKSLAVFQQNPELASFIFRLNALEDSLKERSILIFDQHTPPFDLFRGASTNLVNK